MVIILLLLFLFTANCGEIGSLEYQGWSRYTDKDDGYVIMVPPEWDVTGEMFPGMRGTRFYPTKKYTGEMAGFVNFAVFVKDNSGDDSTLQERYPKLIDSLTEGLWQDIEKDTKPGSLAGRPAFVVDIQGRPNYSRFMLRGRIIVAELDGKDFVFFASATKESYRVLARTFELIYNSVRFPR